jgi:TPR repeat protein
LGILVDCTRGQMRLSSQTTVKSLLPCAVLVFYWSAEVLRAQGNPGLSSRPAGVALGEPAAEPLEDTSPSLLRPDAVSLERGDHGEEEQMFLEPALRGEAWAQTRLGKIYVESTDDPQRLAKGVQLLRAAADQDEAEALYLLATMTAAGRGVDQSLTLAFEQMKRGAEMGFAEAQFSVANMYAQGLGTARDAEQSISWGQQAAHQDHAPAQYALALMLLQEDATARASEAVRWLRAAAEAGHREASFFLAGATAHGDYGIPRDEKTARDMALPWAEAGDAEFQFALATLYLRGEEFAGQRSEAMPWLERAATGGHEDAIALLQKEKTVPAEDGHGD